MLISIAAMSQNRVIGNNNMLPWHLPSDLQRFKILTTGKKIILGRKTYESIGKLLPHRHHIILSRTLTDQNITTNIGSSYEIINNIHSLQELIKQHTDQKIYCIGGGEIYKLLLPLTNKIELTLVDTIILGDTFFPDFEEEFEKDSHSKTIQEKGLEYSFLSFSRKPGTLISH